MRSQPFVYSCAKRGDTDYVSGAMDAMHAAPAVVRSY